jgi:hypothetical protein
MTESQIKSGTTFERDFELDRLESVVRDVLRQAERRGSCSNG